MPMSFTPDTCDCIVIVDNKTFQFIDWIQKCEIHKDQIDSTIIQTILDHNNSFNKANKPDKIKKQDRAKEKERIKKLGKGVKKNES